MTKIEMLIARQQIVDSAQQTIAHHRGRIARAMNRPRTGCLVPRFDTEAEAIAWRDGWDSANDQIG